MNIETFYKNLATVLILCHDTDIDPYDCVKDWGIPLSRLGRKYRQAGNYTFARAIIEGKPVFVGDTLYWRTNRGPVIVTDTMNLESEFLSWTPIEVKPDIYADLKNAYNDGKRIVWKDANARWHDAEKDSNGKFLPLEYVLPLDKYKIIPYDLTESALYYTPISDLAVRLKFTRSQIDNSLTVEIINAL